jgi:hypothetical protein
MAKKNRPSAEEKLLRAMHGLFILQAAQVGLSGAEMRKILGVGMSDVTPVLKASNRAIKKRDKEAKKP